MAEIEGMVRTFFEKVKKPDESLNDKSVALIANGIVNRMQRRELEGASEEELNKVIEDTLFEGVDVRLKLKEEGLEDHAE